MEKSSVVSRETGIQQELRTHPRFKSISEASGSTGMTLDIHGLMRKLSESRPIFHSEADFQHALAWLIHDTIPESQIRLEYPFRCDGKTIYLDIWLSTERIAIELKYFTQKLKWNRNDELFDLKNQSARDIRRYDFLADIQRLENLANKEKPTRARFAVLLTNDSAYWEAPTSRWELTYDADFRLHKDHKLSGKCKWADRASPGTKKGREDLIHIKGSYEMHWKDYSTVAGEKYGEFRYLAVPVLSHSHL